jgi:hypothetical protein
LKELKESKKLIELKELKELKKEIRDYLAKIDLFNGLK